MTIQITDDGFFTEIWGINKENKKVFPHLKTKSGSTKKGFEITFTGKKSGYHLVDLDQFIDHIAKGDFDKVGRVRMKSLNGGQSNGFAVNTAVLSSKLRAEIERRRKEAGYLG